MASRLTTQYSRMPDSTIMAASTNDEDQHHAEGGLALHQQDQRRGREDGEADVLQAWPARLPRLRRLDAAAGQDPGGAEDQPELGELRRLDLEPAGQRDPGLRPVDPLPRRAEHREQQQQRQAVDRRRPPAEPAVVDAGGDEHEDDPEPAPQQLLLQVGVRVRADGPQFRLGRRPDQHRADDGEPDGDGDQQPVPGPGEAALGERAGQRRAPLRRERAPARACPRPGRDADAHRRTAGSFAGT